MREPMPNLRMTACATATTALAAILFMAPSLVRAQGAGAPDLIIYNAKIVTVDGKFSIAKAAAVKDGRFTSVGTDAAVLKTAGAGTVKIDMHGKTVLPGFNDSHIHVAVDGGAFGAVVDLTGDGHRPDITTIAQIQNAITNFAKTVKPGVLINGSRGWWAAQLVDRRLPNRYDLDAAAPNNPVIITSYHYTMANSAAIKAAGITRDTKDPAGGTIERDASGEPTGVFHDTAQVLVGMRRRTTPTPEQAALGIRKVLRLVSSEGITSISEPHGGVIEEKLYHDLYNSGELPVRVDFGQFIDPSEPLDKLEAEIKALGPPGRTWGDGMFRTDELGEVNIDQNETTAMLRQDYYNRPGYRGFQKITTEHYSQFAALAAKYGWRLRPHISGDRGIDEALDAYEYANKQTPIADKRWMMDHMFLL